MQIRLLLFVLMPAGCASQPSALGVQPHVSVDKDTPLTAFETLIPAIRVFKMTKR